jgi:hypothetical protein
MLGSVQWQEVLILWIPIIFLTLNLIATILDALEMHWIDNRRLMMVTLTAVTAAFGAETLHSREELKDIQTDIAKKVDQFAVTLERYRRDHTARIFVGRDEIFVAAAKYVSDAKHEIRVVLWAPRSPAPEVFRQALFDALLRAKSIGSPISDEIIIAYDPNALSEDVKNRFKARAGGYKGVESSFRFYHLEAPEMMDVMIVDERHTFLTFAGSAEAENPSLGMVFDDQPEIARQFSLWFDHVLKTKAQPGVPPWMKGDN